MPLNVPIIKGTIESFDQFVVLLRNTVSQMVYKHAISTVVPARNIRIGPAGGEVDADNGDAEGDSSVPVVPTSMHPSRVLRTRGIPLRLVDGQGVEVGPEADPGLGADVHPETCLWSSVVIDDPVLIE